MQGFPVGILKDCSGLPKCPVYTEVLPYPQFHFPQFHLAMVNSGLEAEDSLSDVLSEGH